MAEQHLDQYLLSVMGGYQLQAGSYAQEFGEFLKTLEAAGHRTKTLWSRLVRQVYDKFMLAGNFCSFGIVFWITQSPFLSWLIFLVISGGKLLQ